MHTPKVRKAFKKLEMQEEKAIGKIEMGLKELKSVEKKEEVLVRKAKKMHKMMK